MVGTLTSFQVLNRDIDGAISRVAQQPLAAREIEYFQKTIQTIKTAEEFLEDRRVYSFAMQAFGLSDMTYAKAFMAKVLEEGVATDDTFANRLSDTRYREFAQTFNFDAFGSAATSFTKANEGTVEKYLRQTLEEQAGADNEGVRLALYFERKAPDISSYLEILAEPAIATVVRTALGIPEATATIDLDKQVALISKKLDINDLKDPEALDKLLKRFTSLWDLNNPSTQTSSTAGLVFGGPTQFGIPENTMLQILQLRRG